MSHCFSVALCLKGKNTIGFAGTFSNTKARYFAAASGLTNNCGVPV